eukprot:g1928.t1
MYFTNGCGSLLHRAIVSMSRGGNGPLRDAHLRVLRPTRLYRRATDGQQQSGTGMPPLPFATVWPVPLLEDNMAYIIVDHATGLAAAVDVCAAAPVLDLAKSLGLAGVSLVLTTHRHHDHSGGNIEMRDHAAQNGRPDVVVAASSRDVPGVTKVVTDGGHIDLGFCRLTAVATPTHTPEHVAWVLEPLPLTAVPTVTNTGPESQPEVRVGSEAVCVFSGDCLFVGGVGACFHGTQMDLVHALTRLKHVPADALLLPGHNYGRQLLWQQAWAEPRSGVAAARAHWADRQAARGQAALPVTFGAEREANAWLRIAGALELGDSACSASLAALEESLDSRIEQWESVSRWRRSLLGCVPHEYSHMGGGDSAAYGVMDVAGALETSGTVGVDATNVDPCITADVAAAQEQENTERTPSVSVTAAEAAERVLQKLSRVHALAGTVDLEHRGFSRERPPSQLPQGAQHGTCMPAGVKVTGATDTQSAQIVHGDAEWQASVAEVVVTEFHHYCVPLQ